MAVIVEEISYLARSYLRFSGDGARLASSYVPVLP